MNGQKHEIDELELVPEALKDLTASVQAHEVRGGNTGADQCEGPTM